MHKPNVRLIVSYWFSYVRLPPFAYWWIVYLPPFAYWWIVDLPFAILKTTRCTRLFTSIESDKCNFRLIFFQIKILPRFNSQVVYDLPTCLKVATGRLRSAAAVGNWRRKNAQIDQNADQSPLSSSCSRSNASALMSAATRRRWTQARSCRLASSGN